MSSTPNMQILTDLDSSYFSGLQVSELKCRYKFYKFVEIVEVPMTSISGGLITEFDQSGGESFYFHSYEDPNKEFAFICSESRGQVFFNSAEGLTKFLTLFKKYIGIEEHNKKERYCYTIYDSEVVEYNRTPLINLEEQIIEELYPEIDIKALAEDYLASESPLLILMGPPGCGKTTFLKYLSLKTEQDIFLLKKVPNIHKTLNVIFARNEEGIFFIDDAFEDIGDRSKSGDFAEAIVAFTSGFRNKTKLVITTNRDQSSIDKALIRKGRCFDCLPINPMTKEYASGLWTDKFNLSKDLFTFEGNTISQAEFIELVKDAKRGSNERRYFRGSKSVKIPIKRLGFGA